MSQENYLGRFTGKRVLVFWTQKAYETGCEWPSFFVIDETDDGIFCRGVARPDGFSHDGSKCFIHYKETYDIIEWKEGK